MSAKIVSARGLGRRLANIVMKSEFTFLVSLRTWQGGYRGRTSAIPLMLIPNWNWGNNRQTALSSIEWWLAQPALQRSFFSLFASFQQVKLYF
jgi:hypothetical protein